MSEKHELFASEDFYARAVPDGMMWVGVFSVPWKRDQVVTGKDRRTRVRFATPHEALFAAAAVVFAFMRDPTVGFCDGRGATSKRNAEDALKRALMDLHGGDHGAGVGC